MWEIKVCFWFVVHLKESGQTDARNAVSWGRSPFSQGVFMKPISPFNRVREFFLPGRCSHACQAEEPSHPVPLLQMEAF
jgi:hypothetical protein